MESVFCWILRCIRVFWGRLVGACGEMIDVVRFFALCVRLLLDELGFSNLSGFMGGDGVAFVRRYLDSAFLPPDSL